MKKRTWMALLVVAVVMSGLTFTAPARTANGDGVGEVEATEEEYCGICESKKQFNELTPGVKWGADQRIRWTYFDNATTLDKGDADHEMHFQRFRSRLWATWTPVENLDINARLVWEWFHFCKPDSMESTPSSDVTFDHLNVEWRSKVMGRPLTIVVGRQDLRLGDGWLVFEGTPLDASRTIYFDAVRMTYEMADWDSTMHLIYVENRADTDDYIRPFNDGAVDRHIAEFDERAAIAYLSNKSLEKTQIDAYYIFYHADHPDTPENLADVSTIGSRVAGDISENLRYRVEAALQFGDSLGVNLCGAMGANSRLTYDFKDEMSNSVWLGYEYRSGDEDNRRNFNILFGRYPQWSDLYNGYIDSLEGLPAMSSNLHRVNLGWGCKPTEKLTTQANYHLLMAAENNMSPDPGFSDAGCIRGHLLTGLLKYRFNEHVSGHLVAEMFAPGDYYTDVRNDVAYGARWEILLSW